MTKGFRSVKQPNKKELLSKISSQAASQQTTFEVFKRIVQNLDIKNQYLEERLDVMGLHLNTIVDVLMSGVIKEEDYAKAYKINQEKFLAIKEKEFDQKNGLELVERGIQNGDVVVFSCIVKDSEGNPIQEASLDQAQCEMGTNKFGCPNPVDSIGAQLIGMKPGEEKADVDIVIASLGEEPRKCDLRVLRVKQSKQQSN